MIIIGVDPGCSGAIAIIYDGRVDHMEMPTFKVGKSNRVNAAALAAFIQRFPYSSGAHCYFEKVGAMPDQGVTSMFTFGHATGLVEGVIVGMGIPITLITPSAWKGWCGLIGKDKDAARTRAIQLYPNLRVLDQKIKGQAVADAILIARYGSQINSGAKEDLL